MHKLHVTWQWLDQFHKVMMQLSLLDKPSICYVLHANVHFY